MVLLGLVLQVCEWHGGSNKRFCSLTISQHIRMCCSISIWYVTSFFLLFIHQHIFCKSIIILPSEKEQKIIKVILVTLSDLISLHWCYQSYSLISTKINNKAAIKQKTLVFKCIKNVIYRHILMNIWYCKSKITNRLFKEISYIYLH